MIDPELLELLESVVTIAAPSGRDLDGKRSDFGTAAPYQAHLEIRTDMVRNASGEEVMSVGRAHLDSHYPAVTEACLLTLPDDAQPSIVAVAHTYDSSGPYQTVVFW